MWTSNTILSTAGFNVIHPLCISTINLDHEQPTSRVVSEILVPSLRAITICPLSKMLKSAASQNSQKSKQTNAYKSPAPVKRHFHLITYLPRHPGEFIAKCRGGHKVLALECISRSIWVFYKKYVRCMILLSVFSC